MEKQEGKRFFIDEYFKDIAARHERLTRLIAEGFVEEALILACCYLSAVASNRYGGTREETRRFALLVREYGGRGDLFDRVSRVSIVRRHAEDRYAPKAFTAHELIADAIAQRFGDEPAVAGDPTEPQVVEVLSVLPGVDLQNIKANLWRYTYGALLYSTWRNPGVHHGQINAPWSVETGRKHFGLGADGAPVFYDHFERLTFSAKIVMEVLRSTTEALWAECMEKAAFPYELEIDVPAAMETQD